MSYGLIIIIHMMALLIPFYTTSPINSALTHQEINWPQTFEGKALWKLALSETEQKFYNNFPGKIARFTDGEREIIFRYVSSATRKLHPASDCLKGSGFNVSPEPIHQDHQKQLWGCVMAEKNGQRYRVCERIYDHQGNSWYDVSSWFWSVILNNQKGPWWTITVASLSSNNSTEPF